MTKIISLLMLMVVIMMIMMAHGHYDTSIRITKICGKTILETLSKIYRSQIEAGIFPDSWKKHNIVPVHKKGEKQILENYGQVSLLSIFGNVLQKKCI